MARYKPYDYNQTVLVPVSLEEQLISGTLPHTIHYVVSERLDLSAFDAQYRNDETGCRAYDPRVLLKVVLLGYALGQRSSRRLEAACKQNIIFMALTCGQNPDHSTFAEFISSMGQERVESIFTQVLMVCEEEGLLGGTHFSLDGLKLSSNASKEWSGTHADLRKKKEKLEELVREAMADHKRNDSEGGGGGGATSDKERKRIERLQAKAERIEKFLAEKEPKVGRQGVEIQSNITDNDSAKMKTAHGIVQGYNAHALVDEDHQLVIRAEAMGEGGDSGAMGQMLAGAQANLEAAGCGSAVMQSAVLSADTGYFSEENLRACEEAEVDAYIPDPKFRSRDVRFDQARRYRRPTDKDKKQYRSKRRWFGPEEFHYDAEADRLICPAGERLYRSGSNLKRGDYRVLRFKANASSCVKCPLRARCLRNPQQKSGRQAAYFRQAGQESITGRMKAKIDTPAGRRIYARRLGNVEPVFANLRAHKGLDRFTLRGQAKVNVQWKLYCLVHNLEKLAGYGHTFSRN